MSLFFEAFLQRISSLSVERKIEKFFELANKQCLLSEQKQRIQDAYPMAHVLNIFTTQRSIEKIPFICFTTLS